MPSKNQMKFCFAYLFKIRNLKIQQLHLNKKKHFNYNFIRKMFKWYWKEFPLIISLSFLSFTTNSKWIFRLLFVVDIFKLLYKVRCDFSESEKNYFLIYSYRTRIIKYWLNIEDKVYKTLLYYNMKYISVKSIDKFQRKCLLIMIFS